MAALASDWLRHFQLLLWNRWMEFNETWQEARSQRPLPSLCFSGRSEKQDGRPGLWLAETFSTSPLKPQNGIQRNLTGSKISTSFSEFVFFEPISKQKCPPWPIPQKGGTLYSGARYVALWASCIILLACLFIFSLLIFNQHKLVNVNKWQFKNEFSWVCCIKMRWFSSHGAYEQNLWLSLCVDVRLKKSIDVTVFCRHSISNNVFLVLHLYKLNLWCFDRQCL